MEDIHIRQMVNHRAAIGRAWAINDQGEIVGEGKIEGEEEIHAVLLTPVLPIQVSIDIKPGTCPNSCNLKAKGPLPAAILGTADLDINDIDLATVRLEGVTPIRSDEKDVATPFDGELCDCHELEGDGFEDLTLKFDSQEIIVALGTVSDGDEIVLTLTGQLVDGTAIKGQDCVFILDKGK